MPIDVPSFQKKSSEYYPPLSCEKPVAILVPGMHRSGTSALSGILNILGAAVPDDLLPANSGNAKGYFEGRQIVAFHDELLSRLGSRWDDPLPLVKTWPQSVATDAVQELCSLVQKEYGDQRIILVKDPRICRLLPMWFEALSCTSWQTVAILPLRHPLEVAASLWARHSLSKPHALILWLQHVLVAERDTRAMPRCFTLYDDLLTDAKSVVQKISNDLGLHWPDELFNVEAQIDAYISSELRHQNSSSQRAAIERAKDDGLLELCMRAWRAMKMLVANAGDSAAVEILDEVFHEFNAVMSVSGSFIASVERARGQALQDLTAQEQQIIALHQALAQHEREIESQATRLTSLDQECNRLRHEQAVRVAELEQECNLLRHEQAVRVAELEQEYDHLRHKQAVRVAELEQECNHLRHEQAVRVAELARECNHLRHELDNVLASSSWRATRSMRVMGSRLSAPARRRLRRVVRGTYWLVTLQLPRRLAERRRTLAREKLPVSETEYDRWVRTHDTITDEDRSTILQHIASLIDPPLISVVMPTYETEERLLRGAIDSVQGQLYPHWELCIADDCSPSGHVIKALRHLAAEEPRIKWMRRAENGNIAAASNSALALATGEFIAFMDHDDLLPETALYEMAASICADRNVDVLYSDEDKIDDEGHRHSAYFKPAWSEQLLLGQNVISHLGVYRRSLLEQIGGFRLGFEGSQDYDLALRATTAAGHSRVRHVPKVLYHWRKSRNENSFSQTQLDRCVDSARRAIADHLAQKGVEGAVVVPAPLVPSWSRVILPLPDPVPLVSVVIPTRDHGELLRRCVASVLHRTNYPNLEIIIADNGSTEESTLQYFADCRQDRRVQILSIPMPFNYSAINNAAISRSNGQLIALLNNDIDAIDPDWLREMVSLALRPEIGCVGAKLLYANETIQHAGVLLGAGSFDGGPGVAGHFGIGEPREEVGYFGQYALSREVSAVTAACAVLRREVFDSVGGFDEANLPVAFNDVDLCLRIREKGYRNIWTPFAELYHLESASRGSDLTPDKIDRFSSECRYMRKRWGDVLDNDPFYNPAFDRQDGSFRLSTILAPKTWESRYPIERRSGVKIQHVA